MHLIDLNYPKIIDRSSGKNFNSVDIIWITFFLLHKTKITSGNSFSNNHCFLERTKSDILNKNWKFLYKQQKSQFGTSIVWWQEQKSSFEPALFGGKNKKSVLNKHCLVARAKSADAGTTIVCCKKKFRCAGTIIVSWKE